MVEKGAEQDAEKLEWSQNYQAALSKTEAVMRRLPEFKDMVQECMSIKVVEEYGPDWIGRWLVHAFDCFVHEVESGAKTPLRKEMLF